MIGFLYAKSEVCIKFVTELARNAFVLEMAIHLLLEYPPKNWNIFISLLPACESVTHKD